MKKYPCGSWSSNGLGDIQTVLLRVCPYRELSFGAPDALDICTSLACHHGVNATVDLMDY